MIPEKWENLYLYASVIDKPGKESTGELFFYYVPKSLLKKNPVNVYEIPSKFNIDEGEYGKLVELLYDEIKALRKEFKATGQIIAPYMFPEKQIPFGNTSEDPSFWHRHVLLLPQ